MEPGSHRRSASSRGRPSTPSRSAGLKRPQRSSSPNPIPHHPHPTARTESCADQTPIPCSGREGEKRPRQRCHSGNFLRARPCPAHSPWEPQPHPPLRAQIVIPESLPGWNCCPVSQTHLLKGHKDRHSPADPLFESPPALPPLRRGCPAILGASPFPVPALWVCLCFADNGSCPRCVELRDEGEAPAVLEVGAGCPPGPFTPASPLRGSGFMAARGFPAREGGERRGDSR